MSTLQLGFTERAVSGVRIKRAQGFSLIELLVAVVIGLLGVLVIFQVVSTWDAQRRTTTSGSDAQVSGTLAGFGLEQDIRLAGWGIGLVDSTKKINNLPVMLGCQVTALIPGGSFTMAPIILTQGAGDGPDTITVLYGNSSFVVDNKIYIRGDATTKTARMSQAANGTFPGDLVVFVNDPAQISDRFCQLVEITGIGADKVTLTHAATGTYTPTFGNTAPRAPKFNPAATDARLTGGGFYNLGPSPSLKTWSIRDGRALSFVDAFDRNGATTKDVAEGIVDLQAQYGYDANGDGKIDATEWLEPDALPVNAEWGRVLAIQVALLSRAQQYERNAVTAEQPTFFRGTRTFVMRNVDGSPGGAATGDPNDWRHYRYRVYEKVIPIRNLLWGMSP